MKNNLLRFQEERGRLMRRNIVRYSMLSYVITLQHVSLRVKQRFPSWQHMVDAGEFRSSPFFAPGDRELSESKLIAVWPPIRERILRIREGIAFFLFYR